jgi:hypothetical protein
MKHIAADADVVSPSTRITLTPEQQKRIRAAGAKITAEESEGYAKLCTLFEMLCMNGGDTGHIDCDELDNLGGFFLTSDAARKLASWVETTVLAMHPRKLRVERGKK